MCWFKNNYFSQLPATKCPVSVCFSWRNTFVLICSVWIVPSGFRAHSREVMASVDRDTSLSNSQTEKLLSTTCGLWWPSLFQAYTQLTQRRVNHIHLRQQTAQHRQEKKNDCERVVNKAVTESPLCKYRKALGDQGPQEERSAFKVTDSIYLSFISSPDVSTASLITGQTCALSGTSFLTASWKTQYTNWVIRPDHRVREVRSRYSQSAPFREKAYAK